MFIHNICATHLTQYTVLYTSDIYYYIYTYTSRYQVGLLLINSGITLSEGLLELRDLLLSKEFTTDAVKSVIDKL